MRDALSGRPTGSAGFLPRGRRRHPGLFLLGTAITDTRPSRGADIVESTMTGFTFAERFERRSRWRPLNTLSVRARTGAQREVLDGLIDAAVDVICGRHALDLAVLRLDQPGQLLQAVDELMQDVGGAGSSASTASCTVRKVSTVA